MNWLISSFAILLLIAPSISYQAEIQNFADNSVETSENLLTEKISTEFTAMDWPGKTEGEGVYFEIKNSEYLNVTLKSDKEIKITLESIPKMIELDIASQIDFFSTDLTINGLEPNKTYYKYEDSYKNGAVFVSNKNGGYNWIQDLTQSHHIWIQEIKGTTFIDKDTTLDHDITGSVEIVADNITLDCNNHNITGVGTGYGIYLNHKESITIKNCNVNNFHTGVYSNSSIKNTFNNNNISNSNLYGIFLSYSDNNTLTGNKMSNNQYNFGIIGWSDLDFDNNIDTTNTVDGKPIYYLINIKDKIYDASTNAGTFYCISCDNVTIKDLTLPKNDHGIFFWKTTNSKIENVTTLDNRYYGIALYYSDNNILNNNTLNRLTKSGVLQVGIFLYSSNSNILNDNTALNNFYGICLWSSNNNTLNNNNATSNDQYGIYLWQSSNNNLTYNTVSKNWSGIYFLLSSSNNLSNNSASNNSSGIYLKSSSNGNTLDNNIVNNNGSGIKLWGHWIYRVNNNILTNNTISNNIHGLNLTDSDNNKVYHNNFISNKFYQANISSGSLDNFFDDGYPSGGNYWSDYIGVDEKSGFDQDQIGNDGMGDVPYSFYGGQDNYPFMRENGWEEPPIQNHAPQLIYSSEEGYNNDPESPGVHKNKGTADKDELSFKIIYFDEDNDAPTKTELIIENLDTGNFDTKTMILDQEAGETFRNGNYADGELYVYKSAFPKGKYRYSFMVSDGLVETDLTENDSGHYNHRFETGYSNVAFLPGLQASRLYKIQTLENQLWEPNRNDDVKKLYMNNDGTSSLTHIYTKDVIDEAYGFNVYKKFEDYMDDEIVNAGIIHEWKALPYDWRLDFDTLLKSGTVINDKIYYSDFITNEPYLLEEIKKLTESSDSGKVSIVAHSMGGLIAKALIGKIKDENHPYHYLYPKIDQLILVASPQLGTPKAIEGLLHADKQQIGIFGEFGILLDEEVARELGENMQSAYNLLPSREYFSRVASPVITFHDSFFDGIKYIDELKHRAGSEITNYEEMYDFLLGDNGKRTEPDSNNEEYPNVLKKDLLDAATNFHDNDVDFWVDPDHIDVFQIVGWGKKTIKGIEYSCPALTCNIDIDRLDRELKFTKEGDGTVVVPSAQAMDAQTYYLNLYEYNDWGEWQRNRSHADILETDPAQELIKSILQNKTDFALPEYSAVTKPIQTDADYELVLRSPVSIDVYDNNNNHTGLIDNFFDSDFRFYEARIPNSYYVESAGHKYVGFGSDDEYDVRLRGEDLGSFTLDIKKTFKDETIEEHTFLNIPVTANTKAKFFIRDETVSSMELDVDGDDVVDITIDDNAAHYITSLKVLEQVIQSLNIENGIKNSFVKKIQNTLKSLDKENNKAAKRQLQALKNQLQAQSGKKIEEETAEKLLNIIDKIFLLMP